MKSFVLFNNKGGVGKTTLSFNIAHMLARQGFSTVILDFDPQSNVTAIFLDDAQLEEIWSPDAQESRTVAGCLEPVRLGRGPLRSPTLHAAADNLWLLPGSLALSRMEQTMAEEWSKVLGTNNERSLDVVCSLAQLASAAAASVDADYLLVDVGPSLGALNRAALLACDAVVVPVAPDLFSLQGLRNVGPTLFDWRKDWGEVARKAQGKPGQELVAAKARLFNPIGYIVQQHLARSDRPVRGYRNWADRVPFEFHRHVLMDELVEGNLSIETDRHCIATLKHFASLVPLAQQARKPMFDLRSADGVSGGQLQSVSRCRQEFEKLVTELRRRSCDTALVG